MSEIKTEKVDVSEITTDRLNEEMFPADTVFDEKPDFPLSRARLDAIPIADPSMSIDQLRQICIDYVKLSVSFQWLADRYMSFDGKPERTFYKGKLYGGIPYLNTASGNLYRILEYYDEETGVLDASFFAENPKLFGTACSGTASWGWQRVINSVEISWTHSMNAYHGFIPVGDYKYDHSIPQIWEKGPDGKRIHYYKLKQVCRDNGEQVMFESYGKALPADCFSSSGHVRMCAEKPVIVRNEDGTIDGEKSHVVLVEQGLFTKGEHHKRETKDGVKYLIRGNDGMAWTFLDLFNSGYLVHTFPEFVGTKKVEKGTASIETKESKASLEALLADTLTSNFPISDVFVTVKNKEGKTIFSHVYRSFPHYVRTIPMKKILPAEALSPLANGENTIEMETQISTGAKIRFYSGTLV